MIGRIAAGLIAVIMLTFIPLKMKAVREAERMENALYTALESAYEEMLSTQSIDKDIWDTLLGRLKACGCPCKVSITVGSVFVGRTGKALRCTYTDEILKEVLENGNTLDINGKVVSLIAEPVGANPVINIANILWVSYIPLKKICVGG